MKATILVRDLVKLIAKHGDLDVRMCVETDNYGAHECAAKCVDEVRNNYQGVTSFELYGEEK